jgi:hypothetical protein
MPHLVICLSITNSTFKGSISDLLDQTMIKFTKKQVLAFLEQACAQWCKCKCKIKKRKSGIYDDDVCFILNHNLTRSPNSEVGS